MTPIFSNGDGPEPVLQVRPRLCQPHLKLGRPNPPTPCPRVSRPSRHVWCHRLCSSSTHHSSFRAADTTHILISRLWVRPPHGAPTHEPPSSFRRPDRLSPTIRRRMQKSGMPDLHGKPHPGTCTVSRSAPLFCLLFRARLGFNRPHFALTGPPLARSMCA